MHVNECVTHAHETPTKNITNQKHCGVHRGFLFSATAIEHACAVQVARSLGMLLEHFTRWCRIAERNTEKQGNTQRPSVAWVAQGGLAKAVIYNQRDVQNK